MKNRCLLGVTLSLTLTLLLPTSIAATELNTTGAQQIVADVFKQHTNDHVRLQVLKDWVENSSHNQDHNWFQRAANMTAQEEQALIQQYAAQKTAHELSMEPVRKAIKFLEDKLEFERKADAAALAIQWEAGREAREKQAEIEKRKEPLYTLAFYGATVATLGAIYGLATLMVKAGIEF